MARMISPLILAPSTPLPCLPIYYQKPLFPSKNSSISTKLSSRVHCSGKPRGVSCLAKASATSTPIIPGAIADVLGEVSIFTAAGDPVQFKNLWDQEEGMAVVALLRHFGCFCCWELASALKEAKEKFDNAGVKLIAVGVGTPEKAQLLAERLPFPLESLYADPNRKAYEVLGLYYGLGRTFFNPASTKVFSRMEAVKKAMKNYTVNATPDDKSSVLQQGGVLVFKGKQLLYARKDEGTGDHAPLDDIIGVCCKVPTS